MTGCIPIGKAIDTLIATRCIVSGYRPLYSNRDFDPFVVHLGLEAAT
ncbi:twitching motility protein PilT [Acetobacter syzygii]|uniref:Twitching motility protein PilT n=1 Tax=Acetobacter syzygii TaxID=146476 RepID=A0A270B7F3_9PROT|nr:twitching motility protein PilT [Acetobacter syzygii]PAL23029.1 twitching motility protein PilT [Acetobacter syzygii]